MMEMLMDETISKLEWLKNKEKGMRNRFLLDNAIKSLKEYDKSLKEPSFQKTYFNSSTLIISAYASPEKRKEQKSR